MINERDTYNQIAYAREFGREEGIKQGLVQGLEQGMVQGMEQGLVQGLEQGKVAEREAIVLRMIRANTPIEFIVKCIGLDNDSVNALAQRRK